VVQGATNTGLVVKSNSADALLVETASGTDVFAIDTSSTPPGARFGAADTGLFSFRLLTGTITMPAAATFAVTDLFAENDLIMCFQARVTTAITASGGGTTWDVGIETQDPNAFGTTLAFTDNTLVNQGDYTATVPIWCNAEYDLVGAVDTGAFTAGVVAYSVLVMRPTEPAA
jgi:hypothetical protein